jgi:ribosomal protein S18 acetylase RimI-like enzyme
MTPNEFHIRPARAEDAAPITECVAAAYHQYIDRIGKPPGPMLDDYKDVLQRHRVFVLTNGALICGVLVLIQQTHSLLVDNVAVHPDHQGRGFGRRLMALAEEEAHRLGFTKVTLYTNEQMTDNLHLYKRLGYRETERKTEHGYKRIYMQKLLIL